MKEISTENVVQAYLSGILAHKCGSVAILNDNGTEFKNKVLNKVCDQLDIKRLFSNLLHPKGNAKEENMHNFLKRTSPSSWTLAILGEMTSFHLLAIVITYFEVVMVLNPHFSLCSD